MVDCGNYTPEVNDYVENEFHNHIDYLIVTHIDNDHINGLIEMLSSKSDLAIKHIFYNCYQRTSDELQKWDYFYIGFLVFEYKEYVMKWIGKYWLILVAINFYLAWFVKPQLFLFHCLSYILILLYLANKLELRASTTTPPRFGYSLILNSISKCSMGIYIIHAWIIWNVTNIESFHGFIDEHFLIFPFICWIFVFLFSWGSYSCLDKIYSNRTVFIIIINFCKV